MLLDSAKYCGVPLQVALQERRQTYSPDLTVHADRLRAARAS